MNKDKLGMNPCEWRVNLGGWSMNKCIRMKDESRRMEDACR